MVVSKSLSHLERRRAGHTLSALWVMINAVKERTDPSDWGRMGLFEVVDLAHALKRGGEQPALKLWQNCKSGTCRPGPGLQERRARRLAVLLCIALAQLGLSKSEARRTAAEALAKTWLFARAPTVGALKHWQERMEPPILTAEDERALARAKACCGNDRQCLVNHFIALVQFSPSP